MRTAAAYALAFGPDRHAAEKLIDRLGPMLDDTEPVIGPDLTTAESAFAPVPPRPARCTADVAYRLIAERPALPASHSQTEMDRLSRRL